MGAAPRPPQAQPSPQEFTQRRTPSPEFKARVAIEASSGRKTIQDIAAEHAMAQGSAPRGTTRSRPVSGSGSWPITTIPSSASTGTVRSLACLDPRCTTSPRAQREALQPPSGGFCFVALETALGSGREPELFHFDQGYTFT